MLGLHIADAVVLVLYLAGITALGIWAGRKIRNMGEFFMPRRFGKLAMTMHGFGTGTHSDQAVSVASKTFTNGLSGIWYQWLWLFASPFYWLIAPMMRRFRAITTGDIFEARYDRSVSMLYAVFGMGFLVTTMGTTLKGSGAIIEAVTDGAIPGNWAIVAMTVLFVAYGLAGGLAAAIVTDLVQGVLTIIFSFMLLPFIMKAVGGMSGLHQTIADREMFSLVAPGEINLFYIIVLAVNALVGIATQPHTLGNCAAGRTELDGATGFMVGSLLKRLCTVAWCFTGLAGVAYFAGADLEPDHIYGAAARDFLPKLLPGLLGIFIASMLASVMSSCDSFMVASAGLFTENLYKRLAPERDEKHYILAARIASLGVVAVGVVYAYWLKDVIQALQIFWKFSAMMGLAFWLGLFWRRATVAGAWASTLASFAMLWLTSTKFGVALVASIPKAEELRLVVEKADKLAIHLPWQMVFYLSAGLIAGIVGSLLSKPVAKEKLETYYALLRAPVKQGEVVTAPCTLPEGAEVEARRVLFPSSSVEIPIPGKTAIIGFVAGWLCVAAIILSVFLIVGR